MILHEKQNQNDIRIGKDRWIEFPDAVPEARSCISIEIFIENTPEFWTALETDCVAGCCGIEAFDLSLGNILRSRSQAPEEPLETTLEELQTYLDKSNDVWFASRRLNQHFPRETLQELIRHIQSCLDGDRES